MSNESQAKKAEIDIWMGQVAVKTREYVKQGMSHEEAEEKAVNDIRREIRRS